MSEEQLAVWIVTSVIQGIIFGIATRIINQKKGYKGGFAWGFFLGIIGLIVVKTKPDNKNSFNYDQSSIGNIQTGNTQMLKEGSWRCSQCNNLNPNQFMVCTACGNKKDGVWKCSKCNNINQSNFTTCTTCGKRKDENYKEAVSSKQNTYNLSGLNPKTKQCPNCGTQYDEDHKFCFSCGSKLTDTARNDAAQNNTSVSSVSSAPSMTAMTPTMQCPNCRLLFKNKEKCPVCGSELVVKN